MIVLYAAKRYNVMCFLFWTVDAQLTIAMQSFSMQCKVSGCRALCFMFYGDATGII